MGLNLTILRSRVKCFTNWDRQAPLLPPILSKFLFLSGWPGRIESTTQCQVCCFNAQVSADCDKTRQKWSAGWSMKLAGLNSDEAGNCGLVPMGKKMVLIVQVRGDRTAISPPGLQDSTLKGSRWHSGDSLSSFTILDRTHLALQMSAYRSPARGPPGASHYQSTSSTHLPWLLWKLYFPWRDYITNQTHSNLL